MSDTPASGFAKLVPGFDFLQNLAKGASQALPQMQQLSNWVAPTLNVEELDKRIAELKAVQFWLDQNAKALSATVQALEVQKMTLATLKGMNLSMGELASAMRLDPQAGAAPAPAAAAAKPAAAAQGEAAPAAGGKPAGAQVVDPLQWWGALTQQFQQIAADALKDVARQPAMEAARQAATDATQNVTRAADALMRNVAPGSGAKPARKAAATPRPAPRKAATRKTAARKGAGR